MAHFALTSFVILLSMLSGGVKAQTPQSAPQPEAVNVLEDPHWYSLAWMQTSAEYIGAARGIFTAATLTLDKAIADPNWSAAEEQQSATREALAALPLAVILDVDETVLDNTPLDGFQTMSGRTVSRREAMGEWFSKGAAQDIPGAVEFLAAAQAKGITPFFITNRDPTYEDAMRRNLAEKGVVLTSEFDTVLTQAERPGWEGAKAARRAHVASTHRVLLVIGDDFGDFSAAFAGTIAERRAAAEAKAAWWGQRWFMVPNPLYGSWERAIFFGSGDRGGRQTPEEQSIKAREALRSYK